MMASMLWDRSQNNSCACACACMYVCLYYMHSAPGPLAHPLQWDWNEDSHF